MHKAWPGIGNNEFPDAGASAGCLVGGDAALIDRGDVLAEELVEQGLALPAEEPPRQQTQRWQKLVAGLDAVKTREQNRR